MKVARRGQLRTAMSSKTALLSPLETGPLISGKSGRLFFGQDRRDEPMKASKFTDAQKVFLLK